MNRATQYFSDEYIERCKELSTAEILQFISDFQSLHADSATAKKQKSKLISLKVEPALLNNFKQQCDLNGFKYQTHIKELMRKWLLEN